MDRTASHATSEASVVRVTSRYGSKLEIKSFDDSFFLTLSNALTRQTKRIVFVTLIDERSNLDDEGSSH